MPVNSSSGACHPEACAIQTCLMNSGYQEERCQAQLQALWRCCGEFYVKKGLDAECDACLAPGKLEAKLGREQWGRN